MVSCSCLIGVCWSLFSSSCQAMTVILPTCLFSADLWKRDNRSQYIQTAYACILFSNKDSHLGDCINCYDFKNAWITWEVSLVCGSFPAEDLSLGTSLIQEGTSRKREKSNKRTKRQSSRIRAVLLICCAWYVSHRSLWAIFYIVHGQLDLCVLVNVGVLEESHTAEEHGTICTLQNRGQTICFS